jgi:hypothetical protein
MADKQIVNEIIIRARDEGSKSLAAVGAASQKLEECRKPGTRRDALAACQWRRENVPDSGAIVYQSG